MSITNLSTNTNPNLYSTYSSGATGATGATGASDASLASSATSASAAGGVASSSATTSNSLSTTMRKFECGDMTLSTLLSELAKLGINAKSTNDGQITTVEFSFENKNYVIRSSNANSASATDSQRISVYTADSLKTTYKFSDEIIKKYFDVVEEYTDNSGKNVESRYAMKSDSKYKTPTALRTALFQEARDQLILSNFLTNNYNKDLNSGAALYKVDEGKTTLSSINYTQYLEEIQNAISGTDANTLKKEVLNKLIKDFSSGNLVVAQLDMLLKTLGVENRKRTLNNGNYEVTFSFEGKDYKITCNKEAASKGSDNVQNIVVGEEFFQYVDSQDLEKLKSKYFEQLPNVGGFEQSYRLKEGMDISEFLKEAKLLNASDIQYLEQQGLNPREMEGFREIKDASGNIIAYGCLADLIEKNSQLEGFISSYDVEKVKTPLLREYFFTQVSGSFYKLNPGITQNMVNYAIENNCTTIYQLLMHEMENNSPEIYETYQKARNTANKKDNGLTSLTNEKEKLAQLISQLNAIYNQVTNSYIDTKDIQRALNTIIKATLELCNTSEDYSALYDMLNEKISNKDLLESAKDEFFRLAAQDIENKTENASVQNAMDNTNGAIVFDIINMYVNNEISGAELELVLREYKDTGNLTEQMNVLIETLLDKTADKNELREFVSNETNNILLSTLLVADAENTTFNDYVSYYKDYIESLGDEELLAAFNKYVDSLKTSLTNGKSAGIQNAIETLNEYVNSSLGSLASKIISNGQTELDILEELGLLENLEEYLSQMGCKSLKQILSNESLNNLTYEDAVSQIMNKISNELYNSPQAKFDPNEELGSDMNYNIRSVFESFLQSNIQMPAEIVTITAEEIIRALENFEKENPGITDKFYDLLHKQGLTVDELLEDIREQAINRGVSITKNDLISSTIYSIITTETVSSSESEAYINRLEELLGEIDNLFKSQNGKISLKDIFAIHKSTNNLSNEDKFAEVMTALSIYLSSELGITDEAEIEKIITAFLTPKEGLENTKKYNTIEEYLDTLETVDLSSYIKPTLQSPAPARVRTSSTRSDVFNTSEQLEAQDKKKWFNSDTANIISDATNIATPTGAAVNVALGVLGVVGLFCPVVGIAALGISVALNATYYAIETEREDYYGQRANDSRLTLEQRQRYQKNSLAAREGRKDAAVGLCVDLLPIPGIKGNGGKAWEIVGDFHVNLANDLIYNNNVNKIRAQAGEEVYIPSWAKKRQEYDHDNNIATGGYVNNAAKNKYSSMSDLELAAIGIVRILENDHTIRYIDYYTGSDWTEEADWDEIGNIPGYVYDPVSGGYIKNTMMQTVTIRPETAQKNALLLKSLEQLGLSTKDIDIFKTQLQKIAEQKSNIFTQMNSLDLSKDKDFAEYLKLEERLKTLGSFEDAYTDSITTALQMGADVSLEITITSSTGAKITVPGLSITFTDTIPSEEYATKYIENIKQLYEHDKNAGAFDWFWLEDNEANNQEHGEALDEQHHLQILNLLQSAFNQFGYALEDIGSI